jgi:hypothetical protein
MFALSKMMKIAALLSLGLLVTAMCFVAFSKKEYDRVASSDGRFVAVAEYPRYEAFLPMFPGTAGDKSGTITLFTRDGRKIGTTRVEMVSIVREIRWTKDEATLPLIANWHLPKE